MNRNGKTILTIDDDHRNNFALSAILRSRGYNCVTASNMEQGFDVLNSASAVDIVLIDMMMPGMDGYEAIPKIRESRFGNLPVIAITAQAMPGDREKCLAAGADGYLSKPVDVDLLLRSLEQY